MTKYNWMPKVGDLVLIKRPVRMGSPKSMLKEEFAIFLGEASKEEMKDLYQGIASSWIEREQRYKVFLQQAMKEDLFLLEYIHRVS